MTLRQCQAFFKKIIISKDCKYIYHTIYFRLLFYNKNSKKVVFMNFCDDSFRLPKAVNIPLSQYQSEKGRYFVGSANYLEFPDDDDGAVWACLCNPRDSGVDLYLTVWTVSSPDTDFEAQLWFNARIPGASEASDDVTTTNFTLSPTRRPCARLCYAQGTGTPEGGVKAYIRYGTAPGTVVSEEDGKFILPPGDNVCIYVKQIGESESDAEASVAFGWYEVPLCD
jgi:hypothetical protein